MQEGLIKNLKGAIVHHCLCNVQYNKLLNLSDVHNLMVLQCRPSLLNYNSIPSCDQFVYSVSTTIVLHLTVQCHISKVDWAVVHGFSFTLAEQYLGPFND